MLQGLVFCPSGTDPLGYPPLFQNPLGLDCFHLELSRQTEDYCRPGDVGGATRSACDCDTGEAPEECEQAVDACAKHDVQTETRSCSIQYVDACQHRVGVVCKAPILGVFRLVSGRMERISKTDLSTLMPEKAVLDLRFSPPGWEKDQLIWAETLDPPSAGYELWIFDGFADPHLVLRRTHKQGWSGSASQFPLLCDDARVTRSIGKERIDFAVSCRQRGEASGSVGSPREHLETWLFDGQIYRKQQAPRRGNSNM